MALRRISASTSPPIPCSVISPPTHTAVKKMSLVRCGFAGCDTSVSYGVGGSKKLEFCRTHSTDGMENVVSKVRPSRLHQAAELWRGWQQEK